MVRALRPITACLTFVRSGFRAVSEDRTLDVTSCIWRQVSHHVTRKALDNREPSHDRFQMYFDIRDALNEAGRRADVTMATITG